VISGTELPLLFPKFRMTSGEELAEGIVSAGVAEDSGVVALPDAAVSAGTAVLVPDVADVAEPVVAGVEDAAGALLELRESLLGALQISGL